MFLEFGHFDIGFFGFSWSRSVGVGSGSSFNEENGDGVLEIWALKIWFRVYLRKVR